MATAQFAQIVMPPGGQWTDNNGNPLSGGKVFVYVAGTTTNDTSYPTYDDGLAGTNANANPVVLDANGRAQVWLQAGRLYKLVVKDSTEATTYQTVDDYSPAQAFPSPAPSEWVVESNPVAFSSTVLFLVTGVNKTTTYVGGRRVRLTQTSGTEYGTVSTSSFGTDTTVRVVLDNGQVVDSGLSAVAYGLLSPNTSATSPPSYGDRVSLVKAHRGSGVQAITTGAFRKIEFDAETVDLLSEYDAVTNYRWTPDYQSAVAYNQRYLIMAQVTLASSIVSAQIAIYKNGSAICTRQENSGIAGGTIDISWIEEGQASTGDYYEIFVNPSGNVNVSAGSGTTWLHIVRLA